MALEYVSGIFFLTPLWLRRTARVVWFHHVHRAQYSAQYGAAGRMAGAMLETLPLGTIYRSSRFLTPSWAIAQELREVIPGARVSANYSGLDIGNLGPGARAERPTLLYLGRLRRYKRVDLLLDLLADLPGVALEIAGDGDDADRIAAEARRRGLADRVTMHGFVDDAERRRLLQRAWVHVTASAAEGWCLSVVEAGACETPSAALAIGGLNEAIRDEETGFLATDVAQLTARVRTLLHDDPLRQRMGRAARRWAVSHSWGDTARETALVLLQERGRLLNSNGRRPVASSAASIC
jgi:glycosyltransferase involved in cell wall biosynthesis